jgi:hypothetical protein
MAVSEFAFVPGVRLKLGDGYAVFRGSREVMIASGIVHARHYCMNQP